MLEISAGGRGEGRGEEDAGDGGRLTDRCCCCCFEPSVTDTSCTQVVAVLVH